MGFLEFLQYILFFSSFSFSLISGGAGYGDIGISTSHDLPLLQEKGDVRADLSVYTLGTWFGTEHPHAMGSVAYAFDDHWGVQGALRVIPRYAGDEGMIWAGQLSGGWFTMLNEHNQVEVFAGLSGGLNNYTGDYYLHGQTGDFVNGFVQVDYGLVNLAKRHIDLGLGMKYGLMVAFPDFGYIPERNAVTSNPSPFVTPTLEPIISFRFGWEHFKFNMCGSMLWYMHEQPGRTRRKHTTLILSLGTGLEYYFNTTKGKRKAPAMPGPELSLEAE